MTDKIDNNKLEINCQFENFNEDKNKSSFFDVYDLFNDYVWHAANHLVPHSVSNIQNKFFTV